MFSYVRSNFQGEIIFCRNFLSFFNYFLIAELREAWRGKFLAKSFEIFAAIFIDDVTADLVVGSLMVGLDTFCVFFSLKPTERRLW